MGWRKAKRTIQRKPYLIDPYRTMSLQEAKRLWNKTGYPSDDAIMAAAWELADTSTVKNTLLQVTAKKSSLLDRSRSVRTLKKSALAIGIAVVLLVGFFSFTVPGRALAKTIYDAVTRIVQNMLYVRPSAALLPSDTAILRDEIPHVKDAADALQPKDLKEAQESLQGKRFVYLNDPMYELDDVTITESPVKGIAFHILFKDSTGFTVSVYHLWPADLSDLVVNVDITDKHYRKTDLPIGLAIEGILVEGDNMYVGYCLLGDCILRVSVEVPKTDELDWTNIEPILNNIEFFQ